MFFDIEEKSRIIERRIKELIIRMEKLDLDIDQFFLENNIDPGAVSRQVTNKNNYSENEWEEVQKIHKNLDEKFNIKIRSIPNPEKLRETYKKQFVIQPHWIYVR